MITFAGLVALPEGLVYVSQHDRARYHRGAALHSRGRIEFSMVT